MNQNFENRDFEHFVKQNADQYRMFPSEKVWKGINNTLHTRRRWYGIGLILLLLSTAAVTGIMLSPSSKQQHILSDKFNSASQKNNQLESAESEVIITPIKANNKKSTVVISPDNTQKILFATTTLTETNTIVNDTKPTTTSVTENERSDNFQEPETALLTKTATINTKQTIKPLTTYINNKKDITPKATIDLANIKSTPIETTIADSHMEEPEQASIENTSTQEKDIYPMTIESVINAYKNNKPSKKVVWQMHVIPVITYRKLNENRPFLDAARSSAGSAPVYSFSDINSVVTHKPDIGIQLGVSAGFPVSKILTFTAGLQFNVSKYNIQASNHSSEIATITLSNSSGGTNTVSTVTNLRNVGGYRASWLHNKYISASLPVGAEVKLSGKRKTIIGVGATVQPTYILGNRAYLLSTDLKNYARVPSLTRKWNINTGFELFAGYSTGKVDWRIGPQVRYQVFSSFKDTYPIKEHLFDFGVKLGITLK
ncbi:MAG: hypothetical protein KBF82_05615 [Chitinophagaceae bacterium]|nr:hypothetical protein [Chitinophagaceae bacterium]